MTRIWPFLGVRTPSGVFALFPPLSPCPHSATMSSPLQTESLPATALCHSELHQPPTAESFRLLENLSDAVTSSARPNSLVFSALGHAARAFVAEHEPSSRAHDCEARNASVHSCHLIYAAPSSLRPSFLRGIGTSGYLTAANLRRRRVVAMRGSQAVTRAVRSFPSVVFCRLCLLILCSLQHVPPGRG